MPANQNSFNTFNDYTTFFERPRIQGRLEVEAGTQDWQRYNGVIWGGLRKPGGKAGPDLRL